MLILVTGAAGFIGFNTSRKLLEEGHTVIGYDNINDYYNPIIKHDRTDILNKYENYTFVKGELCDAEKVNKLFSDNKFDAVIHLAAQAGVRYSLDHPFEYITSNITGFLTMLEAARHHGKPRFVYASSSSVYGANTKVPFSEKDRVDLPISLYSATKRSDELMCHAYTHLYGMETVGLRFFTVYGPWGRPDMAMWKFADAILAGRPIDLYNNGDMYRDFTYIDDIVNGITATITAEGMNPFEVFNLGNHRCEQLMDMVNLIQDTLGIKAELNLLPMQPGDVHKTYAEVEHAEKLLGYSAKTPISVGVPKFVNWYKEYRNRFINS